MNIWKLLLETECAISHQPMFRCLDCQLGHIVGSTAYAPIVNCNSTDIAKHLNIIIDQPRTETWLNLT